MNKIIEFEGWVVPPDFKSDGCTRAPDKVFGIDIKPACRLHDFLRVHVCHYRMHPPEADKIFRRHLKALGLPSWVATLYWFAVKVTRPWFTETKPVPYEWVGYLRNSNEWKSY